MFADLFLYLEPERMTDQHPITPPPELVQQWLNQLWGCPGPEPTTDDLFIATQAAAWGADMELEACCKSLVDMQNPRWAMALQEDRRPKLKSLAEEQVNHD